MGLAPDPTAIQGSPKVKVLTLLHWFKKEKNGRWRTRPFFILFDFFFLFIIIFFFCMYRLSCTIFVCFNVFLGGVLRTGSLGGNSVTTGKRQQRLRKSVCNNSHVKKQKKWKKNMNPHSFVFFLGQHLFIFFTSQTYLSLKITVASFSSFQRGWSCNELTIMQSRSVIYFFSFLPPAQWWLGHF